MDIGPREGPSGDNRRTHRLEVPGSNRPHGTNRRQAGSDSAFDEDRPLAGTPVHRDDAEPDGRDARDPLQARGDLFERRHHLFFVGNQRAGERELERLDLRRPRKPRLNLSHRHERASHQPRTRQQHEGQRDLPHDERIAHAMSSRGVRACPAGLLQRLSAERTRSQNRHEAKQETGRNGDAQCDEQHLRVEADLVQARQRDRRQPSQQCNAASREHHSERATSESERQALRQQSDSHTAAACSHRPPNGKLLLAALGPHQQQIRHVGPRHEQDNRRGSKKHPERPAHISNHRFGERTNVRCQTDGVPHGLRDARHQRKLRDDERNHAGDIVIGLSERHIAFQSSDAVRRERKRARRRSVEPHRQDQLRIRVEEPEGRREHADDLARLTIEDKRLPDGVRRSTERLLPVAVRQDRDKRCARNIVIRRNQSAELGPNAE